MKYERAKLSILTDPMPVGASFFSENLRRFARTIRDQFTGPSDKYNNIKYRGHPAVTRSLIEGLSSIGESFNYNPASKKDLADTVVVLSGVRTLLQMIEYKKVGLIRRLYAGPNIVTFASDHNSTIAAPEIDFVITPSEWVVKLYQEDCPSLIGRCFPWPAGVDVQYWKPNPKIKRKKILIYLKNNINKIWPIQSYIDYLTDKGHEVKVIEYGCFSHQDFLEELQQSILMIGFSLSESQGIAWNEAWSSDVPTMMWRNNMTVIQGRSVQCSTAPYLDEGNGIFFDQLEDFKSIFENWSSNKIRFSPRKWTLENMSDEVCASKLCNKIKKC